MDSAAAKSYEIQAKVRHNADQYRNTVNDLYSWEKEIKDMEKGLKNRDLFDDKANHLKTLPVRSHVKNQEQQAQRTVPVTSSTAKDVKLGNTKLKAETPTEKVDSEIDIAAQNRKEANECKDRGNMYVKLEDYENAIMEYTNAIELHSKEPIYFSNRALCYLRIYRFDECIEDCNKAVAIDSGCVKGYYRRMQANESLGNHMDALKDCTSVLMIEPKNVEAKRSLDRINERLQKYVKSSHGPNFTPAREDLINILPIDKPAYKRSNKPLKRIQIDEIVTARDAAADNLKISDEDIDKLFNSNCGPFVEVKKHEASPNALETIQQINQPNAQNKKEDKIELPKSNKKSTDVEKKLESPKETKPNEKQNLEAEKLSTSSSVEININENKDVAKIKNKRPVPPAPTSTAQFYSNWKELLPEQKYEYLKSINLPDLSKILGAGFSSDTLTDVLKTLHDYYVPNNDPATAATLLELSKNSQVNILSLLMSPDDHSALTRVLNSFACNPAIDASVIKKITQNFNLH